MRILTNMAFWQCPYWVERTDCLYDLKGATSDPLLYPFWKEAWLLFRRRRGYDVVLTMGARESLVYGLVCWFTGQESRQIMTEVFLDRPRPGNVFWHLKTALFRLVARRAIGIITNSTAEIAITSERFRIPSEKVRFVPLQCTLLEPRQSERDQGFVLAAGRTHRDYALLLEIAPRVSAPITVICGRDDLKGQAVPASVTVLREVDRATYLDYLGSCAVAAIPLKPAVRSTGQVVMLEAMGLGKPVVVTRTPGTADYIRHGETGYLVEPGDGTTLAETINRLLANPDLRRRIGHAAIEEVGRRYSMQAHAEARLAAIRSLLAAAQAR